MRQVKVGSLGIRGTVDGGLVLDQVMELASAYATWLGRGPVLVARDTRPSGPMLGSGVFAALLACGCEVLDAGICTTGVAQLEAARLGAGMINVTGAHNPVEWNGLKLFGPGGRVLSSAEGREVLDLWHQGQFAHAAHDRLGSLRRLEDPFAAYLRQLAEWIDCEAIAGAGLRVVIDACNGAGAVIVARLCETLGAELIPLNCEPTGRFPHRPDPTAANLAQVAAIVEPVGAAAGFGLSSDCERVALVTGQGRPLGLKATLPLLAEHLLPGAAEPATVVAGVACDSRVERVAQRHGAKVSRCGIGMQEVIGRIQLEGAVLGGDNTGGVAISRMHLAHDGLAAMALLLEMVAQRGSTRALTALLPEAHVRTLEVPCAVNRAYSAVARMRELARGAEITDLDGIRVELQQSWYHVRVSHTEPVIRIHCEAASADQAEELAWSLRQQVQSALGPGQELPWDHSD